MGGHVATWGRPAGKAAVAFNGISSYILNLVCTLLSERQAHYALCRVVV